MMSVTVFKNTSSSLSFPFSLAVQNNRQSHSKCLRVGVYTVVCIAYSQVSAFAANDICALKKVT